MIGLVGIVATNIQLKMFYDGVATVVSIYGIYNGSKIVKSKRK